MKRNATLLTLIAVVALGAACNGVSPSAPDMAFDEGSSFAPDHGKAIGPGSDCRSIIAVDLHVLPTGGSEILLQAQYRYLGPTQTRCNAPSWTSSPEGAVTPDKDPFKARVSTARLSTLTVFATAPNGVKGQLTLRGPTTSTAPGGSACQSITAVDLQIVPGTGSADILVKAEYRYLGPKPVSCSAPSWTSEPKGAVSADRDPFKAHVSVSRQGSVVVIATAPNGKVGKLEVGR